MQNKKIRIWLLTVFTIIGIRCFGQDPSFSQLFFNHLYLNPAYAGASKYARLGLVYRNQWLLADLPFTTYGVSYDRTLRKLKSGVGINIINDSQANGSLQRISTDFIYAYGIQTSYNSHIRGGLQSSFLLNNYNFSNLVFPDMIDQNGDVTGSPLGSPSPDILFDIGLGFAGDLDFFYGGVAVHHIYQFRIAGQKNEIPRKYTAHLGCEFNLYKWYKFKQKLMFSPNVIYIHQLNYNQLNLGFYFTKDNLVAGFWLRENLNFKSHTFIVTGGYSNNQFRLGYSYDFGAYQGGFRGLSTSTHEVTFGWNFEYKALIKKYRYIKCPKF